VDVQYPNPEAPGNGIYVDFGGMVAFAACKDLPETALLTGRI